MGLLNREKLLTKEDLKIVKVDLGGEDFVYVRQMTGYERDVFERSLFEWVDDGQGGRTPQQNLDNFRAKLAVCTLCDKEGNDLLKPGDYPKLSKSMSAAKLEKIVNAAQALNSISEEDKKDILKNLERVPSVGSTSG